MRRFASRVLTSNAFVPNPLPEAQKSTPTGLSRGVTSKIFCVRYNPKTVKPVLSVQHEFNLGNGIIRGLRNSSGALMMDHIIDPLGRRLFGTDVRQGTISVWEHQTRYLSQKQDSNERIVGIIGHGNVTLNPYFVAWFGRDGLLTRLEHEPISDRHYDCVVIDENNQATVETLRFKNDNNITDKTGWQAINALTDKCLPSSTQVAFSGQRIVKNGQAISRQELSEQIISGLFYDLRHVFRFPAVPSGGYWRDLGMEQFYDERGAINTDVVIKALEREAIATRWQDLTDDKTLVRQALFNKGYEESDNGKPGTYKFNGSYVDINFLDGIYCHTVMGVDKEEGNLCCMQLTGWSNNVGATIQGLSQLAANVFQDAILLSNGGDVFYLVNHDQNQRTIPENKLDDPNWTAIASCENRYSIRAVLLLVANQQLKENDILVMQPNFRL